MDKLEIHWSDPDLEGDIEDVIWKIYDYCWIKTDKAIYLTRDQGETFRKVNWFTFFFINAKHLLKELWTKWRKDGMSNRIYRFKSRLWRIVWRTQELLAPIALRICGHGALWDADPDGWHDFYNSVSWDDIT